MLVIHLLRKCDPAAWAGTEAAIQRLFAGLRAHSVTPVAYAPRLDHQDLPDPLKEAGYRVERFSAFVPILGMPREKKRQLFSVGGNLMSFDLLRALWREREISIVHSHALGRIGGIGLTVAIMRQIPFVVTIHGGVLDLPESFQKSFNEPGNRGWEWGKLFGLLFKSHRLFRDADAILACNENEAALLRTKFPEKRIRVQPHGVALEPYRQDHRETAYSAFPQLRDKDVLLCLGRIDPIKNQHWLVEQAPRIFAKHPNALLVLAGPCTDEVYGKQVAANVGQSGVESRVVITGGLPPDDPRLLGLLQAARVLLLPSLSETFGLVILEAWAAGTPVLSTRTSGAKAHLNAGDKGWLFDLEQPESFHRALEECLTSREKALSMTRRAEREVTRTYNLSLLAGQMKAFYQELIDEKTILRPIKPAVGRVTASHSPGYQTPSGSSRR